MPALGLAAAWLAGCAQAPATQAAKGAPASAGTPVALYHTCNKPAWPRDALARGSQGTTTLMFLIDSDGSVAESFVQKSSGDASLDATALGAVGKCKFRPAHADGKPTRAWMPVHYVWTLDQAR